MDNSNLKITFEITKPDGTLAHRTTLEYQGLDPEQLLGIEDIAADAIKGLTGLGRAELARRKSEKTANSGPVS
jgi:hypothetical protein